MHDRGNYDSDDNNRLSHNIPVGFWVDGGRDGPEGGRSSNQFRILVVRHVVRHTHYN